MQLYFIHFHCRIGSTEWIFNNLFVHVSVDLAFE